MAIDTSEALSPGWWLKRLIDKLEMKKAGYELLDNYYTGEAVIAPLNPSKAVREAYRRLMSMSRTNFAELVVEAVRERMNPAGFRTGADGDELGDKEAWRIWQANELDADAGLVHRASLSMGDGYVIVGRTKETDAEIGVPAITPEDPRQVITEHDPIRRRKVIAALKIFCDDVSGLDKALLFLPGVVFKAARKTAGSPYGSPNLDGWEWMPGTPEPLPTKQIPVVRFANRADLAGCSYGEFEPHLAVLDRINYEILQRLEIATMQAFRQRGIQGVPDKDATGNPIDYTDVFSADPGALWLLPETAKIWESGQVDLSGIRDSIRHDVQDLAAVTRTPLFYLTPDSANGSAEGASLAREGLVFKTTDRLVQAGESWEQVMSLAFMLAGDMERAQRTDMEIIWSSPERFSLAERYDAAVKAQAAGVPWETIMQEVLQYSPQQIERMQEQRVADALLNPLDVAPPGPSSPAANTPVPTVPEGDQQSSGPASPAGMAGAR